MCLCARETEKKKYSIRGRAHTHTRMHIEREREGGSAGRMSPTLPQGLPARRRRHHLLARLIFHPFSGLRTFKEGGGEAGREREGVWVRVSISYRSASQGLFLATRRLLFFFNVHVPWPCPAFSSLMSPRAAAPATVMVRARSRLHPQTPPFPPLPTTDLNLWLPCLQHRVLSLGF